MKTLNSKLTFAILFVAVVSMMTAMTASLSTDVYAQQPVPPPSPPPSPPSPPSPPPSPPVPIEPEPEPEPGPGPDVTDQQPSAKPDKPTKDKKDKPKKPDKPVKDPKNKTDTKPQKPEKPKANACKLKVHVHVLNAGVNSTVFVNLEDFPTQNLTTTGNETDASFLFKYDKAPVYCPVLGDTLYGWVNDIEYTVDVTNTNNIQKFIVLDEIQIELLPDPDI